jgi:hypothetical protein
MNEVRDSRTDLIFADRNGLIPEQQDAPELAPLLVQARFSPADTRNRCSPPPRPCRRLRRPGRRPAGRSRTQGSTPTVTPTDPWVPVDKPSDRLNPREPRRALQFGGGMSAWGTPQPDEPLKSSREPSARPTARPPPPKCSALRDGVVVGPDLPKLTPAAR